MFSDLKRETSLYHCITLLSVKYKICVYCFTGTNKPFQKEKKAKFLVVACVTLSCPEWN